MSKVFITKSNLNSIISSLEENNQSETFDKSNVYKWDIYFLNKKDIERLHKQREFLRDPENLYKIYKKRTKTDSKKYIYEGMQPAYHEISDCEYIRSNFKNYEIPDEIKERGDFEIEKFRKWFKQNQTYLENKPDLFVAKLQIAFDLNIVPRVVESENTGITNIENMNLNELEIKIDSILRSAATFYNDNPDKKAVIKRFQKITFLAFKKTPIEENNTTLNDEELKSFLKEYDRNFKKPVIELLLQYYMVKYNPELKFEGLLLDQLGFKKCQKCCN